MSDATNYEHGDLPTWDTAVDNIQWFNVEDQTWGTSFLKPDTVEVHIAPRFEDYMWELPKKKKNYGKDTKHINKVLKKMGR